MARRLDEEEAAMNAAVLDVALSLGRQFLSQIGGVLVFDVFDNWIPANATSVNSQSPFFFFFG
jgi:hypothetical protein